MSTKQLKVNCPTCKTSVVWNTENTYRPFCSERCKQIDLGAWASESYSIPVASAEQWGEERDLAEGYDLDERSSLTSYTLQ